jgi:hypothetical protein
MAREAARSGHEHGHACPCTLLIVAAVRGYAGCEALAVSNWLLRRDDKVGCALSAPSNHRERPVAGGTPSRRPA